MNEIINYEAPKLPDTLEDLTQFVLVGKAKLDAYMMKLRTVNRLSMAQEIRDQTLKEAQEVSTALIAAEQRIGELLLAIPKATTNHKNSHLENADDGKFLKSKTETAREMGYSHAEVRDYQQMAKHPEVVQKVIEEALANGEVLTKAQVMREIAEAKREAKEENDKLRAALSESEAKRISEKGKIKEVIKEVVPDDYEDLKDKASKADAYEKDFQSMRSEYEKMASKWKASEAEKKSLLDEIHRPENEKTENIRKSALFFCAGVANFIEKYGGYVWLTDYLDGMDESDREGYVRAINAIDAWVTTIKTNIANIGEGNGKQRR